MLYFQVHPLSQLNQMYLHCNQILQDHLLNHQNILYRQCLVFEDQILFHWTDQQFVQIVCNYIQTEHTNSSQEPYLMEFA